MGRPEHQPTVATRRRVESAAGSGLSHEGIAMALGIDRGTLEKHYRHELTVGAHVARVEIVEAMRWAAKKGNVAAARLYLQGAEKPPAMQAPLGSEAPQRLPIAPAGIKAERDQMAKTAQEGTEWADLLPSNVQ
jgi:hypothetical protein